MSSEFDKTNILGYIMIVFIGIIIVKIYFESDSFNLKCIISTVDGNKYCVRESAKIQLVADLLAKATLKLYFASGPLSVFASRSGSGA